jgi:hypothetical protein
MTTDAVSPALKAAIKKQIEDTMVSLFNPEQSQAYKHAPPHLVDDESCPYYYYQREDGHLVQAAKRLCRYWTLRVASFKDRAYLPLRDVSGKGALSLEDLDYMRSAAPHVYHLPKDLQGRTTIYADTRLKQQASDGSMKKLSKDQIARRQRCEFYYICSLTVDNPLSLNPNVGVILLLVLQSLGSSIGPDDKGDAPSISITISVSPAWFMTQFSISSSSLMTISPAVSPSSSSHSSGVAKVPPADLHARQDNNENALA